VHRSGHHAFLSGHRAFLSGAVFFSHNRIKKSQNTTLVCEIHGVRGENPFGNLPAHRATAARRAAQSSRRRPSLPQRLVIFGAGPHREDGFPCPDKKTRCSELFSAVLTKKRRVLTKQHDAPNDSPAPPAEFIAVSTICGAVLTKKHAPLVPEQLAFSTERLFWFHTLDPQR